MHILAQRYQRFADIEAQGSSPLYEILARHVAQNHKLLAFLETMPDEKQQPNLLFAAVRHIAGLQATAAGFERALIENEDAVRTTMLTRSTQTNEPARCAVLLPILAQIDGPIALIEVGASAGLCLLPDKYGYIYGEKTLKPPDFDDQTTPLFHCHATANTPIPEKLPNIVWRRGLDLNPLDVRNEEDIRWLETLIWPEHEQRMCNLKMAIHTAKQEPPIVQKGNLLTDLNDLVDQAPKNTTLIIFHTAVLSYIAEQGDRESFAETAQSRSDFWISNEAAQIFDRIRPPKTNLAKTGRFLLSVSGVPKAWTHPHGKSISWI
ncbi:DUF2332 domain-containing protein [Maritalea sp.]|jgi:hypothetical protein|uniref:DUF2332 domain-containing protein n=1 Tax=Maritalea sp. TaxID=2003361 RepID=UPI0039E32F1D